MSEVSTNKFQVGNYVRIYDGVSIYKAPVVKVSGDHLLFDDSYLFDPGSCGQTWYHYKQCEIIEDAIPAFNTDVFNTEEKIEILEKRIEQLEERDGRNLRRIINLAKKCEDLEKLIDWRR